MSDFVSVSGKEQKKKQSKPKVSKIEVAQLRGLFSLNKLSHKNTTFESSLPDFPDVLKHDVNSSHINILLRK